MYLFLVATHTIVAREDREALVTLRSYWGIISVLGPCFVIVPNVTRLLFQIVSIGPAATLLRTASVSRGMLPATKLRNQATR